MFSSIGGVVIFPLLAFSLLAIALILERIIFWLKIHGQQKRLVKELLHLYQSNPQAARGKLQEKLNLPIARIFATALELDRPTPEEFRLALESAAQAEIPLLRRFDTLFATVITAAPLLGLLGTILGLIQAFAALKIGDFGNTDTAGVSGGISEALISTAAGLLLALFTLLFANMFRSFYRRQLALIQRYGGELELIYRRSYGRSRLN